MEPPRILMLKVQPEVTVRVDIVAEKEELNMCLGIPGQIVECTRQHEHLARSTSAASGASINIGLLEDEQLEPGDWVLIHVGFAMSKIDEAEAAMALASLQMMGARPTPTSSTRSTTSPSTTTAPRS